MGIDYLALHASLIEAAGGEVVECRKGRKRFVTNPGVVLPYDRRQFAASFLPVLEQLRVDPVQDVPTQLAEFLARLTYLSRGPNEGRQGDRFVHKVALDFGHGGIAGLESEPVLFAGVSDEIVKELLSHEHGEVVAARVGRLTSANTAAMEETLYVVSPIPQFQAREILFIEEYLDWSDEFNRRNPVPVMSAQYRKEHVGRLNLGIKATTVTIAMSTMNWKWLFMGRLKSDGNEDEVRRIAARACLLLHQRYPLAIAHPREYGYN